MEQGASGFLSLTANTLDEHKHHPDHSCTTNLNESCSSNTKLVSNQAWLHQSWCGRSIAGPRPPSDRNGDTKPRTIENALVRQTLITLMCSRIIHFPVAIVFSRSDIRVPITSGLPPCSHTSKSCSEMTRGDCCAFGYKIFPL